jgi:hypothetical protein
LEPDCDQHRIKLQILIRRQMCSLAASRFAEGGQIF